MPDLNPLLDDRTNAIRDCVFCAIERGEAPAKMVREWPDAIAFTPLNPVTPGHVLVIPRRHVADAVEDPAITAATTLRAAQLAAEHGSSNILTSIGRPATQSVFHLHVHVVPREAGDRLMLPWGTTGNPHDPHWCGKAADEKARAEAAEQRASSWWEAAKQWCEVSRRQTWEAANWKRMTMAHRKQIRAHRARADAAEAKLRELQRQQEWEERGADPLLIESQNWDCLVERTATEREEPPGFAASLVRPGTPYPDEPTETITPGWWVTNAAEDCRWHAEIFIDQASDEDGNDIAEKVARRIAAALNADPVLARHVREEADRG